MSVRLTRVMSGEEYAKMGEDAVAAGMFRNDPRVFLPGMTWFCPWVWDPAGERERLNKHVMHTAEKRGATHYLSAHYWRDWADKRPPICVVCPNGEEWEIDRKSSNGNGWVVTGDFTGDNPLISCSPSIVVAGYHGFLGTGGAAPGQFTADIEGRGPNGAGRQ